MPKTSLIAEGLPHCGRSLVVAIAFVLASPIQTVQAGQDDLNDRISQIRKSTNLQSPHAQNCLSADSSDVSIKPELLKALKEQCFDAWLAKTPVEKIELHSSGKSMALHYDGHLIVEHNNENGVSRNLIMGVSSFLGEHSQLTLNHSQDELAILNPEMGFFGVWDLSAEGVLAPKRFMRSENLNSASDLVFLEGIDLMAVAQDGGYELVLYRRLAHSASPKAENSTEVVESINLSEIAGENIQISEMVWNAESRELVVFDSIVSRVHVFKKPFSFVRGMELVKSFNADSISRESDVQLSVSSSSNEVVLMDSSSSVARYR